MNYFEALERTEGTNGIPAGGKAEAEAINRFKAFFASLTEENVRRQVDEVYATKAYFNDTLKQVEGAETIKAYLDEDVIHAEIVLLVALVAIGRKVIITDFKYSEPQAMYGTAALVLALSVGYYLVKRVIKQPDPKQSND